MVRCLELYNILHDAAFAFESDFRKNLFLLLFTLCEANSIFDNNALVFEKKRLIGSLN